jgi:aryl-alcohol dehydrogenase-like predicted oxidoreductase/enamine deaminase RidA (YjgF/YER057c/UK114 family)
MQTTTDLSPTLRIPRLIMGLWQIADIERKTGTLNAQESAAHMLPYAENGFTCFDMADHYGSSEIIAGTFKNNYAHSDQIKLFTKWVPEPGKVTKDMVRAAVEKALDRMQQTCIDLMQFHAWHYPDPSYLDAMGYLNELREEGLIAHLGVTNFDAAHLRILAASGIPVVSNQVSHSILDQRAQGPLKAVCEQYTIKLLAYGTLAGGFLTDKWLAQPEPRSAELSTWSQMKYKRFIDAAGGWVVFQQLLRSLKTVADKHRSSIASVASRYVLENPAVGAIIVGARLGENAHIEDHKACLQLNLDAEDIQLIREAQQQLDPIPGDCGDEYRKPPYLTASGDLSHHLSQIPSVFEPIAKGPKHQKVYSNTVWEGFAGYCRAIRKGQHIHVSGTTATHESQLVGGADAAAQTHFIIDKIEASITALGGSLHEVVRTRIFVHNLEDWEAVARAHGERFKGIDPANTLVEARLVGAGYLVEIEAEAIVLED